MIGSLVKYSDFYGKPIPNNPIDLILDIPKAEVIATICAVNARLKPIFSAYIDDSKPTQVDCVRAIFDDFQNPIHRGLSTPVLLKYAQFTKEYNLFTRVTCLYAFQEILNVDKFVKVKPEIYSKEQRENIFKFLLIANENLLHYDKATKEADLDYLNENYFEYFMFKEVPHNQYYNSFNPLNAFFKSVALFKAIENDEFFKPHLKKFLFENFNLEDANEFFRYIIGQYFQSNDDKLKLNYLRIPKKFTQAISILDKLASRSNIKIPAKEDPKIFEFLEIKKGPVFREKETEKDGDIAMFLILDNMFFLEKTYSLFINDFWFDYLRPNEVCNRTDWGNFIGAKFYEPFLADIFHNSFKYNSRVKFRATDDLKFKITGGNEIEYADFYIRDRNEVILVEAKSNYLPVVNGYKEVNSIKAYENLDLTKFYKDYGLTQLATKTIKLFQDYKPFLEDKDLKSKGKVILYPILIVNDPIFNSGYSFLAFRKKFVELLEEEKVETENNQVRIMPLSIINVSELQDMEQSLKDRDQTLFNILRMHFSLTDKKRLTEETQYNILMNFSNVVNKAIPSEKHISARVRTFDWIELEK